jgi:hypothetical protein
VVPVAPPSAPSRTVLDPDDVDGAAGDQRSPQAADVRGWMLWPRRKKPCRGRTSPGVPEYPNPLACALLATIDGISDAMTAFGLRLADNGAAKRSWPMWSWPFLLDRCDGKGLCRCL